MGAESRPRGERLGGGGEKKATFKKSDGWSRPWMRDKDKVEKHAQKVTENVEKATQLGRWPANTILQHHGDCVQLEISWECHPGCPVGMLDAQSGVLKSGALAPLTKEKSTRGIYGEFNQANINTFPASSGGASRFFYQAKAGNSERFFLCRTCDVVGNDRKAHDGHEIVSHPTQKPVQLIRYLQRLVTPPGGTTLDPFVGSGTAGVAANAEGFEFIGIDKDPDYVRISEERVDQLCQYR